MKGGITSGVVYPGAITHGLRGLPLPEPGRRLRGRDRRGGSRVRIPAEPGRPGAYDVLDEVQHEISGQGFVQSLFQPTAEAKPAFDLALRLVTTTGSLTQRLLQAGVLCTAGQALPARRGLTVLVWLGIAALAIAALFAGGPSGLEIAAAILLGVAALPLGGLIVAAFAVAAFVRFGRSSTMPSRTRGGGCAAGRPKGKPVDSGLTDWLYQTVQVRRQS